MRKRSQTTIGHTFASSRGLAKHLLAAPQPDDAPTGLGAITLAPETRLAGTIGYMAPEQFLGDSLDARTDVFQVGSVLYEMLSGQRAFRGASPLERLAAIMMRDPDYDAVPWSTLPIGSQDVLRRALARDRSQRYPTAAAFLRDLEDLVEGRVITELPKVIAVIDLENLTGEPETAWIGSGVAKGAARCQSGHRGRFHQRRSPYVERICTAAPEPIR